MDPTHTSKRKASQSDEETAPRKRPLTKQSRAPPLNKSSNKNQDAGNRTRDTSNTPAPAAPAPAPAPVPARNVTGDSVVKHHYNTVPERGRQWRNTQSKIIGLRSFNNWVKSVCINKAAADVPRHQGRVLDIGCGKGGDLQKWGAVNIAHYVGVDIADQSIEQARARYQEGSQKRRLRFNAEFIATDAFAGSLGSLPAIANVGFDDGSDPRWGGGGFDMVSIMFVMHYSFEIEARARQMLKNVSGSLRKGGKFVGCIPNSDVLAKHLQKGEKEFGNDIYKVRFTGEPPEDGVFRPAFGHKYMYWLEEAVDAPEYVIPWFTLRALAEEYNLELEYDSSFNDIWEDNRDHEDYGKLAERMNVKDKRNGRLMATKEDLEAASLYKAFIFRKV